MAAATRLTIGKGRTPFRLRLELVTSTQAILARKRSGKSYTASVQAEELLQHKQQIAVIDPTSAWWGLRSSADGKSAGYPVVVFGGDHADAPLDFRAGKAMAAAVVEHGFSAIFDIGNFATDEQVKFVTAFCAELLRINREAIHVFMDEADTFAPQKPLGLDQNKCLGTVSRLVKQGGIRGVGFTMITQRPASINKDVLSQVDILTILRMSHPLDIKAATDWLQSETTTEFSNEVKAALPSLPVGTAFFASASLGIAERVEVRERRTFNSGATPRPGERKVEPKVLAQIDIEKLGNEISASVQRLKEESPEYLKKRIAELQAELAKGGKVDMGFMEEAKAAHEELERLRTEAAEIPAMRAAIQSHEAWKRELAEELSRLAIRVQLGADAAAVEATARPAARIAPSVARPLETLKPASDPLPAAADGKSNLTGPMRQILAALGRLRSAGFTDPPRIHVCLFSGYGNLTSTGFVKGVGMLKSAGLVEYGADSTLRLTPAGISQAPAGGDPIRTNEDLWAVIFSILGGPEQKILTELLQHYPNARTREQLMEAAGYSNLTSTGFVKALGRLKSLGYADYPGPGQVIATSQCFLQKAVR